MEIYDSSAEKVHIVIQARNSMAYKSSFSSRAAEGAELRKEEIINIYYKHTHYIVINIIIEKLVCEFRFRVRLFTFQHL